MSRNTFCGFSQTLEHLFFKKNNNPVILWRVCDNQSWRFFNKYLSSCGKIENYVNLIEKCKTESIYWYPWQIEVDNVVQTFTEREMCVDRRRSDGRTFHHVWVSLINHHLIPPTPANILENLEQIFSHYILLFCAHTKLIFFLICSNVNHSYEQMNERLSNSKNFILAVSIPSLPHSFHSQSRKYFIASHFKIWLVVSRVCLTRWLVVICFSVEWKWNEIQ